MARLTRPAFAGLPDTQRLGVLSIRVGKNVKNNTDTIFELEILAQIMRAKIRINVQKLAKKCKKFAKICKVLQKYSETKQNCAKMRKIEQFFL